MTPRGHTRCPLRDVKWTSPFRQTQCSLFITRKELVNRRLTLKATESAHHAKQQSLCLLCTFARESNAKAKAQDVPVLEQTRHTGLKLPTVRATFFAFPVDQTAPNPSEASANPQFALLFSDRLRRLSRSKVQFLMNSTPRCSLPPLSSCQPQCLAADCADMKPETLRPFAEQGFHSSRLASEEPVWARRATCRVWQTVLVIFLSPQDWVHALHLRATVRLSGPTGAPSCRILCAA